MLENAKFCNYRKILLRYYTFSEEKVLFIRKNSILIICLGL